MKVIFGTLKGLDGKELTNNSGEIAYIEKMLANIIANNASKDNFMQRYELAMKLFKADGCEIDISESEKEIIKQIITSDNISVLLAAQAMIAINNAK